MFRVVVLLVSLAVASAGVSIATSKTVTAAVKDTAVNGVEGVNLKLNAPFKIDEYNVGFKYNLAKLGSAPEVIFAQRSFDAAGGKLNVEADFAFGDNVVGIAASYSNDKINVFVEGNSNDKATSVGASTTLDLAGNSVDLKAVYDVATKKVTADVGTKVDDLTVGVNFNTEDQEAVLTLSKPLDSNNDLSPSVNVNTGEVKVGWLRKWEGGSLKTTFAPNDKEVELVWTDNGVNGAWVTTATVPIENQSATKISFARDWNY